MKLYPIQATTRKGYALATVLVLLGVAMFGAGAAVAVTVLDSQVSASQQEGVTAYYVTEAGVQDAMWRINNTTAWSTALQAGNLNQSYTVSNEPASGEGYKVSMVSSTSLGTGYATITVTGTSNNGTFTAQREIVTTVYEGPTLAPTGTDVFMTGGSLSITNSTTNLSVNGGDFYSSGAMTFNQANMNMNGGSIRTPSTYSASSSTISNLGDVYATSCSPTPPDGCQPAAPSQSVPTFNFSYYQSNYNKKYSPSSFQSFVTGSGSTVTVPGPVTYISGNLSIGSWMNNKTLNVTGILVINGNLTVSSSTSAKFNFLDPGNGLSGIFVNGNVNNSGGTWNDTGLFYSSGSMSFTGTQQVTVNGAIFTPGNITVNTGLGLTLTFVSSHVVAAFGGGTAQALTTQYWEEEY